MDGLAGHCASAEYTCCQWQHTKLCFEVQVVLNITNTFDSSFSRWTVGLGIEHQLNELRVAAGLAEEARFRARARNLDYAQLVHPEVSLRTPQCSVVASLTGVHRTSKPVITPPPAV